jgi:hypothetical protein
MMDTINGLRYFAVEFTKHGLLFDQSQAEALRAALAASPATDLFVVSHGWNNDRVEAEALYTRLFSHVAAQLERAPAANGRTFAIAGVLWPSKKFADAEDIPGGGAAAASPDASLDAALADAVDMFDEDDDARAAIERCRQLLPSVDTDERAVDDIGRTLRTLVDGTIDVDEEAMYGEPFANGGGREFLALCAPRRARVPHDAESGGGAALGLGGGAAEAGGGAGLFGRIKDGVRGALNVITYGKMKDRAGVVGELGVYPWLRTLQDQFPATRLHLAGHSFGGRVMASALAQGTNASALRVHSVALLQAAFSQFAFASHSPTIGKDGFFRAALAPPRRLTGVGFATHSKRDKAVGLAYPIASKFRGDNAAGIGGPESEFGAIGSNGAQDTPEAQKGKLLPPSSSYAWDGRDEKWFFNLDGNVTIKDDGSPAVDGHGDVDHAIVAHAVVSAALV